MQTGGAPRGRKYLAIIGDIRGSRGIPEPKRSELQKRLERGLQRVNELFAEELASSFVVTLGDEFQGLLVGPGRALAVVVALEGELAGIPVRYGLGWGAVTTELRDPALGMDGPCFHRARDAVLEGKRADRWVTARGFGEDDTVLDGVLWLIGAVRSRWTVIQRETVEQVRAAETQRDVAAARGVSPSTVSEALRAALHESVLAAEKSATALLERHDPRHAEVRP